MKRKACLLVAAASLLTVPAMAQEVPQTIAPAYNCDFMPSCEVAPGMYGRMASPVLSKFNMSIGGFVKLDYAYNSVNLGANGALAALQNGMPKDSSPASRQDQSIFTARQSRLWLKAAGPTLLGAKTNAILEMDFYGAGGSNESANLRLRLANGSLDWANTQLVFGQAYDIFGPAIASSIDFGSGNKTGAPNNPRVPQIRVTQKVNLTPDNALRLVLGVQNPVQNTNLQSEAAGSDSWGGSPNVAGQAMWVSKALGVAPGYFGLSMNSLTAGVFGLYGKQEVGGNNEAVDSWGYGVYTFVPVLKSVDGKSRAMTASFEGQLYMAANQSVNGATAGTFVGPAGEKKAAQGFGLYGQLIFFPTQELGITAGYGKRSARNQDEYREAAIPNFERNNSNLYLNVSYDLNAAIRVAAEYQHLRTEYGNVVSGTGNLAGNAESGTANVGRLAAFYFF